MAELPSNPVPFEVLVDETTPHRVGIEILAYSHEDPFTPLDVIPRRFEPQFLDEVGGPGGGSFRVFRNDEKLTETPTLLDYRNVFKCVLDGKVVGAVLGTNKNSDYVNRDERSGEYWAISGEGLRGWLHDAVVEPYGGIRTDSQSSRVFSFASEQGSWYKTADWVAPVLIQKHSLDPVPGPFNTAPADWPDAPDAYWIWGEANTAASPAPEGINYFRYEFDVSGLSGAESYSVFAAAKDHFQVFLDGQQIIDAQEDDAYSKTWRADFDLTNGHHILAVKVLTKGTGVAGMIAALFKAGDATAGTEATLLKVTNATGWKVNAYPDPAPGWTPGEIMLTLLDEAQARGVRFPTWLTPTFTETHDSDGAEWSRALDWSFDIGSEYSDVVEKLEELVCDLWIDPASYELHMYGERGVHRDVQSQAVEPVKFEVAKNVARASSEGKSEIKNSLLLSTEDGWQSISDGLSTSIAKYGRIEGYVNTGASSSVSGDVAQRVFKQRSEPTEAATYEIIDVDAARPFFDFSVGDWVLAPTERDETLLDTRRVMSLSVSEDAETGLPTFAVEFDTIAEDLARRFDRWLKTTSDGTLSGSLANAGGSAGGGGGTPSGQTTQKGPQGSAGPRGFPGFNYRSVWDVAEIYAISDVVAWNGKFWVAKRATNEEPGVSAADWDELIVAPTESVSVGITLSLSTDASIGTNAPILWTNEVYKSGVTHDANSSDIGILDAGPYLITASFDASLGGSSRNREYQVLVNGIVRAIVRSSVATDTSAYGKGEISGVVLSLAASDVVRIQTTGSQTHTLFAGTPAPRTWLSLVKTSGSKGDTGLKGDKGDDGTPGQGFAWKNTWATATDYLAYDVVAVDGSSYLCTNNHTASSSNKPETGASWTTYWTILAKEGDQGIQGDPGRGLEILGYLPDVGSLPTSGVAGDAYVVNGYLWAWSTDTSAWEDLGRLTVPHRQTIELNGVTGEGTITASTDFRMVWLEASGACRVRFYRTTADRTSDMARPSTAPPQIGGVVLGEFRWEGAAKYWTTGYVISLEEGETTVYYRIDDGTVDLTICWLSE